MDFTLSKKHEMARQLFKEFAENEVKPLAQEVDETEHFPEETVAKMQKLGFMGIPVPKEYGGQGCDPLTYIMCVEELSKVCGTTGVIVSAHTSLCADPILTYGTEEQKQKYLVPLAKGEKLGAFGLTEPGAGTDAQGVQTKAVQDEAPGYSRIVIIFNYVIFRSGCRFCGTFSKFDIQYAFNPLYRVNKFCLIEFTAILDTFQIIVDGGKYWFTTIRQADTGSVDNHRIDFYGRVDTDVICRN